MIAIGSPIGAATAPPVNILTPLANMADMATIRSEDILVPFKVGWSQFAPRKHISEADLIEGMYRLAPFHSIGLNRSTIRRKLLERAGGLVNDVRHWG
ncbi:MAG TPA: hypothetical protein VF396_07070 [Bradyrhizobium sp.]|jgi:hypothetical protein